jgi:hypothetical protein
MSVLPWLMLMDIVNVVDEGCQKVFGVSILISMDLCLGWCIVLGEVKV